MNDKKMIGSIAFFLLCSIVLAQNSKDFISLAKQNEMNEEFHLAKEYCSKAIKLDPNNYKAYFIRARVNSKLGYHEEVISDCSKCIRINPDFYDCLILRAKGFLSKGELKMAEAGFTKSIETEGDNPDGYYWRGIARGHLGNDFSSLSDLFYAIELDFMNPELCYLIIARLFAKNNDKLSIEFCNKAIDIDPDFGLAYYLRGISHEKLGAKSLACSDMRQAFELGVIKAKSIIDEECIN